MTVIRCLPLILCCALLGAAEIFPEPRLMPQIKLPEGEQPVQLRRMAVEAEIDGIFARCRTTLVLHNPNPRPLEGELRFPLPEGALIEGYALDIDGELVEAVVVGKQEARRILEAEERRGIDPGLVEQMAGNWFRTMVYPLPANGSRTVRIDTVAPLRWSVGRGQAAWHLPLPEVAVPELSLSVFVAEYGAEPELVGAFGNLSLDRWQRGWRVAATLRDTAPGQDCYLRLPRADRPTVLRERLVDDYYALMVHALPASGPSKPIAAWTRIGIAWDASASIDEKTRARNVAAVEALLRAQPALTVELQFLRNRPQAAGVFGPQQHQALLECLRTCVYDGGSDLSGFDPAAGEASLSAWLLFSDGLATLGSGWPKSGQWKRVHCLSGGERGDHDRLRAIAERGGGQYVDLVTAAPEGIVGRLLQEQDRVTGVAIDGQPVSDWQARELVPGSFLVLARAAAPLDAKQISVSTAFAAAVTVALPQASSGYGPAARSWARAEAARIALDRNADRDALLVLGQRYHVVTAGSSLLVLENLEQHLRYGIEPPASRPELLAAYRAQRKEEQQRKDQDEKQRLDLVAALWAQRKQWWQTEFSVPAGWRWQDPGPKQELEGGRDELRALAPPSPAALDDGMMLAGQAEEAAGDVANGMVDRKSAGEAGPAPASIRIQAWSPDTPYLRALRAAAPEQREAVYLAQRASQASSPAFYLDCAGFFFQNQEPERALRVLSNLAELGLDDPGLWRIYAWRLREAGVYDRAIELLERVLRERDEEPQSYRDLALALIDRCTNERFEVAEAQRAVDLLYTVVRRSWSRTHEIELIALMELNAFLEVCARQQVWATAPSLGIDQRLLGNLPCDLRISLAWDVDLTDVDLHVFEPTGEHTYFGHNRSQIGGLVSRDITDGFGPEEYLLRKALPGVYTIKLHYYGSRQQILFGPATCTATVITGFGTDHEQRQTLTLRLSEVRDMELVGEVTIGEAKPEPGVTTPVSRAKVAEVKAGMSIFEVVTILGQPVEAEDADTGIRWIYSLPGGHRLTAHFVDNKLVSLSEAIDGGVLDLLGP